MDFSFAGFSYLALTGMVMAISGAVIYERRRSLRIQLDCERSLRIADLRAHQDERTLTRLRSELMRFGRLSMISELAGALAHELNQPLTSILSNAQAARRMLDAGSHGSEVQLMLNDIVAENKRAVLLMERLRSFLEDSGPERARFAVAGVAHDVLALAQNALIERNVSIATHFSPTAPAVLADRVQIQQVLLNLLMIAGQPPATGNDRRPRSLTLATSTAHDGSLLVSLSEGFQASADPALHELFTPVLSTTDEPRALSFCRSIVEAHGGRMWAIGNPGASATHCFTLPAAPVQSETPAGGGQTA